MIYLRAVFSGAAGPVVPAKRYLGSDEAAPKWLKRPNRALGGKTPLELLDTELGSRAVEKVLGRIAFGGVR